MTKVTDYIGNKVYEQGVLKKILVDGGYIEDGKYYFTLQDHLGNTRMVLSQDGSIVQREYYYPFGMTVPHIEYDGKHPYRYNGKELDQMHRLDLYDYSARYYDQAIGRFTTVDPLAESYYNISPYAYVANNPLKYIDPDGRKIRIANNRAGAMENVAKIAATTRGAEMMNRLISRNETYTMNSVFWSDNSEYKAFENGGGLISYVGSPLSRTSGGGWLKSFIAMGHETMHGYDHSYNEFSNKNAGASDQYTEPRAVSFENYLREVYGYTDYRDSYGNIKGNFHQFTTNGNEKISNFSTIGNNKDKTSYGYSYVKKTNEKEVNRFGYQTGKTITSEKTYYMTVSVDKDKNLTYKIYDNEKEYKTATNNW